MADNIELIERAIRCIREQYPGIREQDLRDIFSKADIADVERLRGAMSRLTLEKLAHLVDESEGGKADED